MSNKNMFLKSVDYYTRQLDPIGQYVTQTSFYLHKMSGKPVDACRTHVMQTIKDPANGAVNPIVRYFERDDNQDKSIQELPLTEYLKAVIANKEILAPTYTTYLNSEVRPSILVDFTDSNKKRRSIAKKESFQAKAAGLMDLYIIKDNEQTNMKLYNNSMSGAFATVSSVLHNPTGHSTLTSTIRSITSLSNALNEKNIEGNRHYYNPDVTLYNLISLITYLDRPALESVMEKYQLHYPSVADVMTCIRRSTDLYWHDARAVKELEEFVIQLDALERAAIVYISDFYHVRYFNDGFIRQFLGELSLKVTGTQIEECLTRIHQVDEMVVNLAHQICFKEMKGNGKRYDEIPYHDLETVVATCYNIEATILKYQDFISAVFLTHNVPSSTAYLPNMMRRTVVVSDTDSTLFSVDSWVQWHFGNLEFTDASVALAASVMFIATQAMAHGLAIFSANMGVEKKKLFDLAMKPEFVFPVFAQTPVAKHYFCFYNTKEGNVYNEPERENKGANLISSNKGKVITSHASDKMWRILMTVYNNDKISLVDELKDVADLERRIQSSLLQGETEFFNQSKIKLPESYSGIPERSPYLHHMLWQDVFEPKYGMIDKPPYSTIKIPTTLNNITAIKHWVTSIEDRELATRLAEWLAKYQKKQFPTMYLSDIYVKGFGIPPEIKPVIDTKRIIMDLTGSQRMILDTIGFSVKTGYMVSELGY